MKNRLTPTLLVAAAVAVPLAFAGLEGGTTAPGSPHPPAPSLQDAAPSQAAFVREFTVRYLESIARRRELQDRDLVDGRAWARAVWSGADEKSR